VQKDIDNVTVFFALLETAFVKAQHKTLVKSAPGFRENPQISTILSVYVPPNAQ